MFHVAPLDTLVEQFERLPGIGHKSARRLAFYMLGADAASAGRFIDAITVAREIIRECRICCNLTDQELCYTCRNSSRDGSVICVVEDPMDVAAMERAGDYDGQYHVLHGTISPMDGVGPDAIRIKQLLHRCAADGVAEVIMATNPTVEGEATALYIARLLAPFGIRVTRLAYGMPMGGDLEYTDGLTIRRSLEGRRRLVADNERDTAGEYEQP